MKKYFFVFKGRMFVKKLLKFFILLVCVFVVSNLKLKAVNGEPEEECSICSYNLYYKTDDAGNLLRDAEDNLIRNGLSVIELSCDHKFHAKCIYQWLKSGRSNAQLCPLCRKRYDDFTAIEEVPREEVVQQEPVVPQQIQQEPTIVQQPRPTVAQPTRIEIQNATIITTGRNSINCQILTPRGFAEVKTYLQNHHEVVKLCLILTDNIRQVPGAFFIGLAHLQWLNFVATFQLRSLPASIWTLSNLKELYLSDHQFTSLPPEIRGLRSLRELWFSRNQLTELPAEIGQLIELKRLYLNGNQLTSLPPEIGLLRSLEQLDLDNNQLRFLPARIGRLTSLRVLRLEKNRLTSLPAEIGQLSSLKILSLIDNQLTSLPPEIGQLRSLERLDLDKNRLTSFQPSIGLLRNLEDLFLDNNHIIPWPTELIHQLQRQNEDIRISGEDSQTQVPQPDVGMGQASFFKRIGSKIKFAFSRLFQRSA